MATTSPFSDAPSTAPTAGTDRREIIVISHSNLFYWWPVWFFGFVFALLTYMEGNRLAIVPPTVTVVSNYDEAKQERSYDVKVPPGKASRYLEEAAERHAAKQDAFKPRVSQRPWMGSLYCFFIVLVVFITNVPLRGLWSAIAVLLVFIVLLVMSLTGVLDKALRTLGDLHVYINMAGYLTLGTVIFALWAVVTLIFDRQRYMVFTPGQVRVCEEVGAGEVAYDTIGLVTEKHRDDIFRHLILGFGSGDLTIRTSGASAHVHTMNNVLFIGWKLKQIEEMQRDRPTVQG